MNPTHSPNYVFRTTPGWYVGDFHAHTTFSDGKNSPNELVELAVREGLDFLTITDHNTTGGFSALGEVLPLPVVRGIEVTLPSGHFNVIGMEGLPAWLQLFRPERKMETGMSRPLTARIQIDDLMQQCQTAGFLVSINHPLLEPWAWCEPDIPVSRLTCLEIWNDPTWPDNASANPAAVDLWTKWLNAGHRVTAIGGTDFHYTRSEPGPYRPALNLPRTMVYADHLSVAAILEGVRKRRVYVTMEPTLHFRASCQDRSFGMGCDMGLVSGDIELEVLVRSRLPNIVVQIVRNGEVISSKRCRGERERIVSKDRLPSTPVWYRCDVRDQDDRIIAVSNPIFAGDWPPPSPHTFGEFLDDEKED